MLSVRSALLYGVIAALAGGLARGVTAEDRADAAGVERAIAGLNAPEWQVRENAERSLVAMGAPAVHALARCAATGSPEAAMRAVRILGELYDADDAETLDLIETDLETLQSAKGSVGEEARRAWEAQRPLRERRALAKIEELGGRVDYAAEAQHIDVDEQAVPSVNHIVIGPKWRGGDEGLKHLLRLSQVWRNGIKRLYRVKGASITEAGKQKLEDAGFSIDDRGAFLGIASNVPFGGPDNDGCEVDTVRPGSPADKGGLQPHDLIVKFDDQPVTQFNDLIDLLKGAAPGQKVTFTVIRDKEEVRLPVELGDW